MNDVDWKSVGPALTANIFAAQAGETFDPKVLRRVLGAPRIEPTVQKLIDQLVRTVQPQDGGPRNLVLAELCRAVEVQLRTEIVEPIPVFRHLMELGVDARALEAETRRLEQGNPAWHSSARVGLLADLKQSRELLEARGEGQMAEALHLPSLLPLDVAGALALIDRYGLTPAELELRPAAPTGPVALALPPDLVELYTAFDGIGRFVAPADSLVALQQQFLGELRAHVAEDDEQVDEPGAIDLRSLAPFEPLLAIGTDHGGDTFFRDPRRRTREGSVPVLRFVHDENCVVTPEAASLGAFVAALAIQRWAQRSNLDIAWRRQRACERARGMPVGDADTT